MLMRTRSVLLLVLGLMLVGSVAVAAPPSTIGVSESGDVVTFTGLDPASTYAVNYQVDQGCCSASAGVFGLTEWSYSFADYPDGSVITVWLIEKRTNRAGNVRLVTVTDRFVFVVG
jgi:hypothetical protein